MRGRRKKKYVYFIGYCFQNPWGHPRFLNGELTRSAKITCNDDIEDVAMVLEDKHSVPKGQLIILGLHLLREAPDSE